MLNKQFDFLGKMLTELNTNICLYKDFDKTNNTFVQVCKQAIMSSLWVLNMFHFSLKLF